MRSSTALKGTFLLTAGLFLLEAIVVSAIYKHLIPFTCRDMWPGAVCGGASSVVVSFYTTFAVLMLFPAMRPGVIGAFSRHASLRPQAAALHLAGLSVVLVPALLIALDPRGDHLSATVALWSLGAGLMAVGGAGLLAPAAAWRELLRAHGRLLAGLCAFGVLAPAFAILLRAGWTVEALADATFRSVGFLLEQIGYEVAADPVRKSIAVDDFGVNIAPVCSGVEGIGLITVFMAGYLYMLRREIRLPLALILFPIGWAASALFNIFRIALLLIIGVEGAPELAVDGFHSHAGWLMFTILASAFMAAAHFTPWLRKPVADPRTRIPARAEGGPPPFRSDWNAARLTPFIVFMATALLASTFVEIPGLAYPARFAATAAALLVFHSALRRIDWRVDLAVVIAGLVVGLLWIVTDPAESGSDPLGAALAVWPLWAFALWVVCRVLGTAVVVPIVEELVFRSYLLERLDLRDRLGRLWGPLFAVAVSTALFAALHDRWTLAALAGLVFAWAALRRGRIADAIWCHAAANALIAGYALATGRWTMI